MKRLYLAILLSSVSSLAIAQTYPSPTLQTFTINGGAGSSGAISARNSLGAAASGANGDITSASALGSVGPTTYSGCYWSDTNSCTPQNVRVRERMFVGNATLMNDTSATWAGTTWAPSSSTTFFPGYVARDAQLVVMSDAATAIGAMAAASVAQTNRAPIALSGVAWQNSTTQGVFNSAWAGYLECDYGSASGNPVSPTYVAPYQGTPGTQCIGLEIDGVNFGANTTEDPYYNNTGTRGLWVGAGGAENPANPSMVAIGVTPNGTTWNTGLEFKSAAVTADANGNMIDIAMPKGGLIQWYTAKQSLGASITSDAFATVKLGGLDQATPFGQTLTVQNVLAGGATTDTQGADFVIQGSLGVGNRAGGAIKFNVGKPGTSGNAQDAVATLMTISGASQQVLIGSTLGNLYSNGVITNARVQFSGTSGSGNNAFVAAAYNGGGSSNPAGVITATSRSGTSGAQLVVQSGDQVGQWLTDGSDGSLFQDVAKILVKVNGTVSTGIVPGEMDFATANSSGVLTNAMIILPSQVVNFPALTTGTPAASACFDASGNLIKKTTAGSCI